MAPVAYLDTTILAEVCLKQGAEARRIESTLATYAETAVSAYALKEFRAGVLNDLVYYFNALANTSDAAELFSVLDNLDSKGFRRYRYKIALQVTRSLARRLPRDMLFGQVLDRLRDELSDLILDAWEDVHQLGTVIEPIPCFDHEGPCFDERSKRFHMPICWGNPPGAGCCVAIKAREIDVIAEAVDALAQESKAETRKRIAALEAARHSPTAVSRYHCRHFGDFAIVLYAPDGAHILSTNKSDFSKLCLAMNKVFRDLSSPGSGPGADT